jgi:hypothetical protein
VQIAAVGTSSLYVLKQLSKNNFSFPTLTNISVFCLQVPDYHQVIKKPMDFLTMQKKLARLSYASPQEFVEDAILVFSNAAKYNTVLSPSLVHMNKN